jgi:[ribosomal protein S5]-alanine N-acetyltransferase
MKLSGQLVTIRSWRQGDQDSLVSNANDREVWMNLRDVFPHPYTAEDADFWVRCAPSQQPEAAFAICENDVAVGGIGLKLLEDIERCSAELGYWIGRRYWGRGYTTDAVRTFTPFAMEHFRLARIFALPFASNSASARVLQKAGFRLEGRLRRSVIKGGEIRDQLIYAITDLDVTGDHWGSPETGSS